MSLTPPRHKPGIFQEALYVDLEVMPTPTATFLMNDGGLRCDSYSEGIIMCQVEPIDPACQTMDSLDIPLRIG
jgi:hypothetical protein